MQTLFITTLTLTHIEAMQAEAAARNLVIIDCGPGDNGAVVASAKRVEIVDRYESSLHGELFAEEAGTSNASLRFSGIELGTLEWHHLRKCNECKDTKLVKHDEFRGDWAIVEVVEPCKRCSN